MARNFRTVCQILECSLPISGRGKDTNVSSFGLDTVDETSQVLAVLLGRVALPAASRIVVVLHSDPDSLVEIGSERVHHFVDLNIGILCWAVAHVDIGIKAPVFGKFEVLESCSVETSVAKISLNDQESNTFLRVAGESGISDSCCDVEALTRHSTPADESKDQDDCRIFHTSTIIITYP